MRKQFTVKNIFHYTDARLREWFPNFDGYDVFLHRLNILGECFISLCHQLSEELNRSVGEEILRVMDSFPIVLANNKRSNVAKVAPELAQ